jgi:1-acyl-sn-glycerol-3-phosphate acyltransferase
MSLSIELVASLEPALIRMGLPPWVAGRLANFPEGKERAEALLSELLQQSSDADIQDLQRSFSEAGEGFRLFPANPLARRISRIFLRELTRQHEVVGLDSLDRFLNTGPSRRMIVCNHLSYTDTQVTDTVLDQLGRPDIADRLVAVAGPKVYTEAWRRMAAVALNTRKTPQSSAVATEVTLSPRQVAKLAIEAIDDCCRLMDEGKIILLYPEGTRSRTGQLGSFLRAAARYTSIADLQILPLAQSGTERIFPIDDPDMYASPVRLAFGLPLPPQPGRNEALEQARAALTELLPDAYKPLPGTEPIQ